MSLQSQLAVIRASKAAQYTATTGVAQGSPPPPPPPPPAPAPPPQNEVIDLCDSDDDPITTLPPPKKLRLSAPVNTPPPLLSSSYFADLRRQGHLNTRPATTSAAPTWGSGRSLNSSSTSSSSSPSPSATTFTLQTINLWFDELHQRERMNEVSTNLLPHADITTVQEATASLLTYLKNGPTPNSIQTQQSDPDARSAVGVDLSYGCAILTPTSSLSHTSLSRNTFMFSNSRMARGVTFQIISKNNFTLLVGSTHLESFLRPPDSNGSAERRAQLLELKEFVAHACDDGGIDVVVVAGDMNHDDHPSSGKGYDDWNFGDVLGEGWSDAYVEAKGAGFDFEESLTYYGKGNPMLANSLKKRFDRILYYTPPESRATIKVQSCEVNGKNVIPGITRPLKTPRPVIASDHFGVRGVFELEVKGREKPKVALAMVIEKPMAPVAPVAPAKVVKKLVAPPEKPAKFVAGRSTVKKPVFSSDEDSSDEVVVTTRQKPPAKPSPPCDGSDDDDLLVVTKKPLSSKPLSEPTPQLEMDSSSDEEIC